MHSLSMLTLPSATTTTCGPRRKLLVWSRRAPKVNRLLRTLKLNKLTFLKSQPTLPVHDVTHIFCSISYLGFYFDICEWCVLSARAWTPAFMLHLTNPCAKRKVLSLTKPKGKIYKTKSPGYYITVSKDYRKLSLVIHEILTLLWDCPVDWGRRIHWLLFCCGVRLCNECPEYDTKQSDDDVPVMLELWGRRSTPSFSSLPGLLRPGVVAPDSVLSMGQIKLNCELVLNWIAWNRTVLTCKLGSYAKLHCLKWNGFCMLNWIVWNRTVFDIETALTLSWIAWNRNVFDDWTVYLC